MNAWQAYRSLSAEQKKVLTTRTVDLKRSPDDLIAMLTPLATYDKALAGMRRLFGIAAWLGFIGGALLYFRFSPPSPAIRLALGALVVITVGAVWMWRWARRADLSDNLRDTALPALKILREDFARKRQVHIRLDLRLPTDKSKTQGKTAPYALGNYHHVVDEIFLDPWMSVDATLNDGGRLAWKIVDSVRVRKRRKRSASGKTKFSTRKSKKTSIEVQLILSKKRYDVVPDAGGRVKSSEKRHVVSMERKIRGESLDPVSPTALIDLVADAYRNVQPAGTETRV